MDKIEVNQLKSREMACLGLDYCSTGSVIVNISDFELRYIQCFYIFFKQKKNQVLFSK